MQHMGVLVPNISSLKDFLATNHDIEEFIKSDAGSQSLDPVEALERFLNGGRAVASDVETIQ